MKSEKQWQQESDARTLMEAETIRSDPGRMKGAKVAAKRLADERAKELSSLNKVAGKEPIKLSTKPGGKK